MSEQNKTKNIISWILRLAAAAIFLQTLFFKFTGAPESIYIFETVGAEPVGRIGSGIMELFASILLLIPRTKWVGAFLGLGVISGALLAHLTILGIEVQGDGGTLFTLGVVVFVACLSLVIMHLGEGKALLNKVRGKS